MALEQGFIFKFAQHHEFITSFWNVGENGHSTSTVLGLTSRKSNSKPQTGIYGVLIPFQPLIEWCFDCVWAVPVGNETTLNKTRTYAGQKLLSIVLAHKDMKHVLSIVWITEIIISASTIDDEKRCFSSKQPCTCRITSSEALC